MVLRLSLVFRQNVLLEPKALHLIDRAIDVLTGARKRVEAPGDDSEVDGERHAAVLFADLVVDDSDGLVPVADNPLGPQAEGVVPVGVGDCLGSLGEQVFDDLLPIGADHLSLCWKGLFLKVIASIGVAKKRFRRRSVTARQEPHLITFLLSLVRIHLSSWVDGPF